MVKISLLPSDSAPTLTDEIPTRDVETNTTKKTVLSAVRDLIFNNIPTTSPISTGWNTLSSLPYQVTYNGNHNYVALWAADLTGQLSAGMRVMFQRDVAAPTKCTSLNGTTQYFSKASPAGMTFTDDFTVSAWIKLNSYSGNDMTIASRYDGTSGWRFSLSGTSGRVQLIGLNGGAGNLSYVSSYQSIPLNKWVHVAAQLDMSAFTATTTTSYVMIDGVDVPASVTRLGTNPTALIQAGSLQIGASGGGDFFPGKLAQVAIYSAKVTQATIRNSISQTLTGTETSEISAYTLNNSASDLNANANNLTPSGAATVTNADSPYAQGATAGLLEHGIITNISYSGATIAYIQVPEGSALSSAVPAAVSYSGVKVPYGFPGQRGKWIIESIQKIDGLQGAPVTSTWYNVSSNQLTVPVGEWVGGYEVDLYGEANTTPTSVYVTLSTTPNSVSDTRMQSQLFINSATSLLSLIKRQREYSLSTQTIYYLNGMKDAGVLNNIHFIGSNGPTVITFELAHL